MLKAKEIRNASPNNSKSSLKLAHKKFTSHYYGYKDRAYPDCQKKDKPCLNQLQAHTWMKQQSYNQSNSFL